MRGRRAATVLLGAALLLGGGPGGQAQKGAPSAPPAAEDELTVARAAIEDGLYELALGHLEPLLAAPEGELDAATRRDATLLMLRALHGEGRFEDALQRANAVSAAWTDPRASARLLYWRAVSALGLGRTALALDLAESFEERYPDHELRDEVVLLRARAQAMGGERRAALATYAAFHAEHAGSPLAGDALLQWGRLLLTEGLTNEARVVFGRLVKIEPPSTATREGAYWLATVLRLTGKVQDAEQALLPLVNTEGIDPNLRARAWYALADIDAARGNREGAIEAYGRGAESAVAGDLKRGGRFARGRLLLQGGDQLDEAVAMLKTLVSEHPGDPAAGPAQLALAGALLDAGRHEASVAEFQYYLESYTNVAGCAEAQHGRGWGLYHLGRFEEAAQAFRLAQDKYRDPADRQRCLFKVGDALAAGGRFEEARRVYEQLLETYPDGALRPAAMFQAAECLARAGHPEKAEAMFQGLMDAYPDHALSEEALLRIAELAVERGAWTEAVAGFERVLATYTNGVFAAEALHGRGLVRYRLFRFKDALADFRRVVEDYPDSRVAEHAFYQRALCRYWMGQDEQALAICREFLERFPESRWVPDLRFWMAKYHFNSGHYEEAVRALTAFAAQSPQHELADDALLWAGIAAARRHEYVQSAEILARMVRDYPASPKVANARFAQAEAMSQLAQSSAAILIYDEIINKYPNSGLVAAAWGRKGDCQFTLGGEDPKRYEESIDSYAVVASSSDASPELVLQAEYKIGRSYEKLGRFSEAFDQYYAKVIVPYFEMREKGGWPNEAAKVWFTRAAFHAAEIMESRNDWRRVVSILQRVVDAGVPAAEEAAERIQRIRTDKWWLFY